MLLTDHVNQRNWVVTPACTPKQIFGDVANSYHNNVNKIMLIGAYCRWGYDWGLGVFFHE